MLRWQIFPRQSEIDVVGFSHRFEHAGEILRVGRSPRRNRSIDH